MGNLSCQSRFGAREARLDRSGGHPEYGRCLFLGKTFEHTQRDDLLVGVRERPKRLTGVSVIKRVSMVGAADFWGQAIE